MTPAAIALIIQGIQAAITAAPGVIDLINKSKDFITALFTAKLITVEQQNAMHAHVDALCALAQSGIVPPAWQVEPDPPTA